MEKAIGFARLVTIYHWVVLDPQIRLALKALEKVIEALCNHGHGIFGLLVIEKNDPLLIVHRVSFLA
jgi:hypothetical protein